MMAQVNQYSLAEVKQHSTKTDLWVIIRDKVYDVTKFLEDHPGGDEVLIDAAGKDATKDFDEVGHSEAAISQLNDYYIGDIIDADKKIKNVVIPKNICLGVSAAVSVAAGLFILYKGIKALRTN